MAKRKPDQPLMSCESHWLHLPSQLEFMMPHSHKSVMCCCSLWICRVAWTFCQVVQDARYVQSNADNINSCSIQSEQFCVALNHTCLYSDNPAKHRICAPPRAQMHAINHCLINWPNLFNPSAKTDGKGQWKNTSNWNYHWPDQSICLDSTYAAIASPFKQTLSNKIGCAAQGGCPFRLAAKAASSKGWDVCWMIRYSLTDMGRTAHVRMYCQGKSACLAEALVSHLLIAGKLSKILLSKNVFNPTIACLHHYDTTHDWAYTLQPRLFVQQH